MLKYAHLSQSLLFSLYFTETSAFKAKKYKLLHIAIIMVFLTYTIYVLSSMQAYPLCSPSHSCLISFLLFNVLFVWGLFFGCDFGWFFTRNAFYKENTWGGTGFIFSCFHLSEGYCGGRYYISLNCGLLSCAVWLLLVLIIMFFFPLDYF